MQYSIDNFKNAVVENNHEGVAMILDNSSEVLTADEKGFALKYAAEKNYHAIICILLDRCINDITVDDKDKALIAAAKSGHHEIVNTLLDKCTDGSDSAVDEANVYWRIAKHVYHKMVHIFLNKKFISASAKGEALWNAAMEGFPNIVSLLLDRYIHNIDNKDKGLALFFAAGRGQADIISILLDRCINDISDEHKDEALKRAVEYSQPAIVRTLLDRCINNISDNGKGLAIYCAANNGDLEVLNALLSYPSVERLATWDDNAALTAAQMLAQGEEQNATYFRPIISRLREIPAVVEMASAEHVQADLVYRTRFSENAMQALSSSQKRVARTLESHYGALYEDKGWKQIQLEIIGYLENQYQLNPAKVGDESLPLEWLDERVFSEEELKAYYLHDIHAAWRYIKGISPISQPNQWLHPQAMYLDPQRHPIMNEETKKLLGLLWLAVNDDTVNLEEGSTLEGNKNLLAVSVLQTLARGHNHDERALNAAEQTLFGPHEPNIQTTCSDDQQADKPSCCYGIEQRLLECPYGHPYISSELSAKSIHSRIESLLIKRKGREQDADNLLDRLDRLNEIQCRYLAQKLSDSLELAESYVSDSLMQVEREATEAALIIPHASLSSAIEKCEYSFDKASINDKQAVTFSSFPSVKFDSYRTFIEHCANHPLDAFATTIRNYLVMVRKVKEIVQPAPMDEDKSRKRQTEQILDIVQAPSKRRRVG